MMVSMAMAVLPVWLVADYQLALAAADGNHRVDGLDASLYGRVHRLAHDHVGRNTLYRPVLAALDGPLAVDRLAKRIDHAAHEGIADGHRYDAPGAAHQVAFADVAVVAHDDNADRVFLKIEDDTQRPIWEFHDFAGGGISQTNHSRDAVTDLDNGADVYNVLRGLKAFDLLANQVC